VLVGNPAAGSRTASVARVVAQALLPHPGARFEVVEVADVAERPAALESARDLVSSAGVLVVATPVHKASFTGVLKVFLDGLDATSLESTVAVPVVLGASSAHGALADLQLRIVLQAVGALLPVPSFVLEEHHLDHTPQYVDAWRHRFGPVVAAVVSATGAEPARR